MERGIESTSLPTKTTNLTATTFSKAGLSRFGAFVEVVRDEGCEFKGEFSDLLNQQGRGHQVASREHPQAYNLAQRMVLTLKQGLKKSSTERVAIAGTWLCH